MELPFATGFHPPGFTALGSTMANLAESVAAWRRDGIRRMQIVEDERRRYVQVLVTKDGRVVCEVVSNVFLDEELQWTPEQEDALEAIGFTKPSSTELDNFCNFHFDDDGPTASFTAVRMLQRALLGPFGLTRDASVKVLR
jgi:hypothetical protein